MKSGQRSLPARQEKCGSSLLECAGGDRARAVLALSRLGKFVLVVAMPGSRAEALGRQTYLPCARRMLPSRCNEPARQLYEFRRRLTRVGHAGLPDEPGRVGRFGESTAFLRGGSAGNGSSPTRARRSRRSPEALMERESLTLEEVEQIAGRSAGPGAGNDGRAGRSSGACTGRLRRLRSKEGREPAFRPLAPALADRDRPDELGYPAGLLWVSTAPQPVLDT